MCQFQSFYQNTKHHMIRHLWWIKNIHLIGILDIIHELTIILLHINKLLHVLRGLVRHDKWNTNTKLKKIYLHVYV